MLERFKARGLVKARGRQRTDSTHVLAAVRDLSWLELRAETLRAALDDVAMVAPDWLRGVARPVWFKRHGRRVEEHRLPEGRQEREAFALGVGVEGFALLDALDAPDAARELPVVGTLRPVWGVHYAREGDGRLRRRCVADAAAGGRAGAIAPAHGAGARRAPLRALPHARGTRGAECSAGADDGSRLGQAPP